MKQLKNYVLVFFLSAMVLPAMAQKHKNLALSSEFIDTQLKKSNEQIKDLAEITPLDKFPQTFRDGKSVFSNSSWWCSGFYPGTLLLLSEATNDPSLLRLAEEKMKYLEKEQFNKGTHDLGFMLFCSFGQGLRLTKDTAYYKPILMNGGESLTSRFHPNVGLIKSWDHGTWKYPVIIDNMMNLEFLTQLSKLTGNTKYRDIAIQHADKTLKNHFRKDYSSYHVIDYDPNTGEAIAKKTHQGAFDESAWARGQGWALYGYTMMYRETKKKEYLNQARKIAQYILNNPNLPKDLIPYWDFDKDKVPADSKMYKNKDLRDASAAALYASAWIELAGFVKGKEAKQYLQSAEQILKTLSSDEYFAKKGENGGFLLKHSVGALPLNSEVDVPLSYADYYYVEALMRYKHLLES